MKKILIISLLSLLCLFGCKKAKPPMSQKIFYTKQAALPHKMWFSALIQPISFTSISSPVNASIWKINARYGSLVQKGQTVFVLSSMELQKQYNETLTDYLKAKDSYNGIKSRFLGTQELWKDGLISRNNYLNEQSSLNNSRIALFQAQNRMQEVLQKMGLQTTNFNKLDISAFDHVKKALNSKHDTVELKAPTAGVLLYPPKNEDHNAVINIGSTIKADQVLGLVGDLSGISVEIEIPEVEIEHIHPGMKAKITAVTFGKETLQGVVSSINTQASNSPGSLPTFSARIIVSKIPKEVGEKIRVGMSASIELVEETKAKIIIPIAAVQHDNGKAFVMVQDKSKQLIKKYIITGLASADKVEVDAGLSLDEAIVYG